VESGEDSERAKYAFDLEKKIFRDADRVVVTTPEMHRTVIERYQAVPERVRVIPNFVQVDRFKPAESPVPSRKLCFVGRMHREKNLENLLEATRGLDLELLMIGGGELREPLERRSREENRPVRFLGNVPNANLPGILQEAAAFVFPSLWEHHPKALLEAMACGLPVIGTRVAGIQELIEHRQTGYLCGTSAEELRAAIQAVLNDPELRIALGRNARDSIVRNFSLERVIELELALLEEMAR
jgi:glycosyltransferase involved in cell wall biosynthesis